MHISRIKGAVDKLLTGGPRSGLTMLQKHSHTLPKSMLPCSFAEGTSSDDIIMSTGSEVGALLVDGLGDGIAVACPSQDLGFLRNMSFGVLQGSRMRNTKTGVRFAAWLALRLIHARKCRVALWLCCIVANAWAANRLHAREAESINPNAQLLGCKAPAFAASLHHVSPHCHQALHSAAALHPACILVIPCLLSCQASFSKCNSG